MRFANIDSITRFCLSLLCLLGCALVGCGVNETTTPDEAVFYPLPSEYHIKDEYFIAVHPVTKHPEQGTNGIEVVRKTLVEMFNPRDPTQSTDSSVRLTKTENPILGCGGSTDPTIYQHDEDNLFCIRLPDPERNIRALLRNDQVRYVEAHGRVALTGVQVCPPSWGLDQIDENSLKSRNGIYGYSKTGDGVHVFIIDTGIAEHADLSNRVGSGAYIDNTGVQGDRNAAINDMYGHGTMLAGIVAGKRTGVAKKAIVHPIRVFPTADSTPPDKTDQIDMKIEASHNAVINAIDHIENKLDGGNWCKNPSQARVLLLPFSSESGLAKSLGDKVKNSIAGCKWFVVTGAGNKSEELAISKPIPAVVDEVFTVGAYNEDGRFSGFSNRGAEIDILAPGDKIQTIAPNGTAIISGTSAAAAFVAGVAAQFLEDNPGAGYAQIADRLKGSAIRDAVVVPSGIPNLMLRSPYADGKTGDKYEVSQIDGARDSLSSSVCNDGNVCSLISYCNEHTTNQCTDGLKHLVDRSVALLSCNHGVDCSYGVCWSCGLMNERCCAQGTQGDARCGDNLECNQFERCTCGGMNEVCCENGSCGIGLGCGLSAQKKPICTTCGLESGQPCCGNTCARDDLLCLAQKDLAGNVIRKTCVSCGQAEQRCCGTPHDPCESGSNCGSDDYCHSCGGKNEDCCARGQACGGGLQCNGSTKKCEPCGGSGEACCSSPFSSCIGGLSCRAGKCGEWKSCALRCKNGAQFGLGDVVNNSTCETMGRGSEGKTACEKCDRDNPVFRVRYGGDLVWEDKNCGQKGVACCADHTDKNTENDPTKHSCSSDTSPNEFCGEPKLPDFKKPTCTATTAFVCTK